MSRDEIAICKFFNEYAMANLNNLKIIKKFNGKLYCPGCLMTWKYKESLEYHESSESHDNWYLKTSENSQLFLSVGFFSKNVCQVSILDPIQLRFLTKSISEKLTLALILVKFHSDVPFLGDFEYFLYQKNTACGILFIVRLRLFTEMIYDRPISWKGRYFDLYERLNFIKF